MGKPLKELVRRTIYAKRGNLSALDDPYPTLQRLLAGHDVKNVIDAGASTGTVSKRLAKWFPDATFHLFEPHPDYETPLQELAASSERFKPVRAALSDIEEEITLYLTRERGPTSRYRPNVAAERIFSDAVAVEREVTVPALTLDQWAARESVGPIQLIKLDIQGGELAALRGGRQLLQEQVLAVYTEIMFRPIYEGGAVWAQIDDELRQSGFVLHNLFKPVTDQYDALIQANAIYIHPARLGR